MLRRESIETALFRSFYGLVFVAMLAPLLIVMGTSVAESGHLRFPPEQVSLKWYVSFLSDERWIGAVWNSLITSTGTMLISTTLGVTAALGVHGTDSRLTNVLVPLALLPLLIPAVVIGVTLLMFLSRFGLQQSYVGIIIAHSLWATPLVFFIMQAVFTRFDWELKDAGHDLGATPLRNFGEVMLPNIRHGIFASAIIAFIISLQEFIMALFLSGYQTRTIPVLAWVSLRQSLSPLISVVSTLLILGALTLLVPAAFVVGLELLAKQL
ncbi:ABC transporter permease [Halobellus marinus]|uniref:ABC transporter permease n=1 Tax=Halobellus TaxID=1073986 RepID=UPI0028A8F367|nr:ABC transporter permease [Halobellus sp. DFY28]